MNALQRNIHKILPITLKLDAMRPLKLYVKTTILASVITVLMMIVGFSLVTIRIAGILQEKEKDLARLQAAELAEHIIDLPNPQDASVLLQLTALVLNTQPDLNAVRVWKIDEEGNFIQIGAAENISIPDDIPDKISTNLAKKQRTEALVSDPASQKKIFRAFAPLVGKNNKVFGAVEISEKIDSSWSIAAGYAQSEAGVVFITVLLILFATYLLFRYVIYHPLASLLNAMTQAETGNLDAQAKVSSQDELGQLALKFNRMVSSLKTMTEERKAYQNILQDRISEATKELQEKNDQLTTANRELWRVSRRLTEIERLTAAGQTAAQLAHEVGTPLNLISGHIQLLRLKTPKENAPRLDIISAQIERIERIVRKMLDRTKISHGEKELISINEVLRRTFDATAPMFAESKVSLLTKLEKDLPLILGNADHLQQIFINLINNSLDAMNLGGKLTVKTSFRAEKIVIEFTDDGIGMTAEVCSRIFDVLYSTKGNRGSGLGLVVVKQLVQEHGGEVEVESQLGKGTRFTLILPPHKDEQQENRLK